jgi:hypothetical protein
MAKLNKEQTENLQAVMDYMKDNERKHLEECFFDNSDEDVSCLTDDDLYNVCVATGANDDHIWLKLHKLSELL